MEQLLGKEGLQGWEKFLTFALFLKHFQAQFSTTRPQISLIFALLRPFMCGIPKTYHLFCVLFRKCFSIPEIKLPERIWDALFLSIVSSANIKSVTHRGMWFFTESLFFTNN